MQNEEEEEELRDFDTEAPEQPSPLNAPGTTVDGAGSLMDTRLASLRRAYDRFQAVGPIGLKDYQNDLVMIESRYFGGLDILTSD